MKLTYSPWVPKDGMHGWFRDLCRVWADPNSRLSKWPRATLEAVCERGPAQAIVYDECAVDSRVYFINPKHS